MSSSHQFSALQTARLNLRPLSDSDQDKIIQLRSDPEVNKYLERPLLKEPDEAIDFIHRINDGIARGDWWYWVISIKSVDYLIGTVCLFNFSANQKVAEIGYELLPEHQGKGYMSEALEAVLAFAFENLKLEQLDAYSHRENQVSLKILSKLSFVADPDEDQTDDKYIHYILPGANPKSALEPD